MMKKWGLILIVALLLVPMALTACGGDDDKDEGGKASDVKLGQTFSDEATGITVNYPDGWSAKADDSGGVILANSEAALDMEALGENDLGVAIMALPLAMIGATDLESAFTMFSGMMTGESETVTAGEVKDIKVGSADAKSMTVKDSGDKTEGVIIGFLTEDGTQFVLVAGAAYEGKMSSIEGTALAVAATIKVAPPAAG